MTQVDEQAEMRVLLAEYKEGRRKPVEVKLGEMPASATDDMRRVAENVRLLIGLRLTVGQDEPLPYSTSFAAELMGWGEGRPNRMRASRALGKLCDAGVILHVGELPPRAGVMHGTKLYAAPLAVGAGAVESEPVEVKPIVPFEPEHEVDDDGLVGDAVLAIERGESGVASGDRAALDHEADGNDASGDDASVPCPDPLRCRYRWRHASGPWSCEFNHPQVRSEEIGAPARRESPGAWPKERMSR
jgi:hypothetical protein